MSEEPLPEGLSAIESALRGLAPHAGGLDRDELLFRAGRASAPRRWPWALAAGASAATAGVLAVLLALRPAPAVVERVRYVPAPATTDAPADEPGSVPPEALRAGPLPHLQVQEKLINHGLDGLGERPADRPSILPSQGDDLP
jgi:hypothetical protein